MHLQKYIWIILIFSSHLIAQKRIENQKLIWYGYYNQLKWNDKWSLNSEIQERHFYNPVAQHQLVFRSNLDRVIKGDWNISAGMTLFLQSPNDPNSDSNLMVPELRLDIGFSNKQKIGLLTISHRYKAEARFFHDVANERLVGGFRFSNFRFRYQLGLDFPLWKEETKEKLLLRLKDEIMFNAGRKIVENTFDQNRIYLGLNYKINANCAIEVGYLNWFQQQKNGIDFYDRDIIRFSVFHIIHLKRKNND